jgi:uncharacterized protein (DUF488 family)
MKVYVKKDCMDSKKEFHVKGSTPEMDKDKEQKLFDLDLVEEFDAERHTEKTVTGDEQKLLAKIAELEALVEEFDAERHTEKTVTGDEQKLLAKIAELEASVEEKDDALIIATETFEELKELVIQTSELPKGQLPEGFDKFKGE